MGYQKFCYWVDFHTFGAVQEKVRQKGGQIVEELCIPCRILRSSLQIGFAGPSAWNGLCKRKTSWYSESGKKQKFLVASSTSLDISALQDPIIISASDFQPDRLPSREEIRQLVQSEEYQKRKPRAWEAVDPLEKDLHERWFRRFGVKGPFDFDKIFQIHSGNHANFLDPEFFVTEEDSTVPYSIADSLHVCSSCLEFFDILGSQSSVKYVVPCIGAVQFARLPMNQYLRVEKTPGKSARRVERK